MGDTTTHSNQESAEIDDLLDGIRQTCGDCEHPRCLSIIKRAKESLVAPQPPTPSPNTPIESDELRKRIAGITEGWLTSALQEYDIAPTNGSVAWRTRKINDELLALVVSERNKDKAACANKSEQAPTPPVLGDDWLENLLDEHAKAYARGTYRYMNNEITEAERNQLFHESDLKSKAAIQAQVDAAYKKAYMEGYNQGHADSEAIQAGLEKAQERVNAVKQSPKQ